MPVKETVTLILMYVLFCFCFLSLLLECLQYLAPYFGQKCVEGTVCLQREVGDNYPGCQGGNPASSQADFCILRNGGYTLNLGADPVAAIGKFQECEGDCDSDLQVSF
jgi:hypothetical protein